MVNELPIIKIGTRITNARMTGNSSDTYYIKEITYVGKLLEIKKPDHCIFHSVNNDRKAVMWPYLLVIQFLRSGDWVLL